MKVEGLSVSFHVRGSGMRGSRSVLHAVNDVHFDIRAGETLGLVGESGSGKTTLGLALAGLVRAQGRVEFEDKNIVALSRRAFRPLRRRIQVVFQDPGGSLDPRMTIGKSVAEPIRVHRLAPNRMSVRAQVDELLELVGILPDLATRYPHELSGGQRQRVAIARALAVRPSFLICDEPVSALDVSVQAQVVNLLVDLRERLGLTSLFIGHDLAVVRYVSHRIAVMYLGRIIELADVDQIFEAPSHPYTRALLSASPEPDPSVERSRARVVLRGDLPTPLNPPAGCPFHPRCWLYERLGHPDRCTTERPLLTGDDHLAACHFRSEARSAPLDAQPVAMLGDRLSAD